MKKQKIKCAKCKTEFEDKAKRSFLGFLLFTCPKCSEKITYPLTGGYRIIYWLVVIGLILYSISALSQGAIPIPGLLGIAAIIGLMKDHSLRNKIAEDELLHKEHASENKSGLLRRGYFQLFINGILIFAVFTLANFFMDAFDSSNGFWAYKRFDEVETLLITTSATVLIVFLYTKIAKKLNL
jgi:DNA-directed RNA polymerase subunit RPC12/RpoP